MKHWWDLISILKVFQWKTAVFRFVMTCFNISGSILSGALLTQGRVGDSNLCIMYFSDSKLSLDES